MTERIYKTAFVFISPIAFLTILIAAFFGVWWGSPTIKYIQPVSLAFDGEKFEFDRLTPRGPVWGSWKQEIRSPKGNCSESGISYYQDEFEPASYGLSKKLAPCVPENGLFIVSTQRSVLWMGFLPLPPAESIWSCSKIQETCTLIAD
jgi:hypothetical protein